MSEPIELLIREVACAIECWNYNCSNEAELQEALLRALYEAGHDFEREHRLSERDRPDFLVAGCLVIEVKVGGSVADLLRQLQRYASHDVVQGLLVVTTRSSLSNLPAELQRKPVRALRLWSASL